jgi:hypothetical protein
MVAPPEVPRNASRTQCEGRAARVYKKSAALRKAGACSEGRGRARPWALLYAAPKVGASAIGAYHTTFSRTCCISYYKSLRPGHPEGYPGPVGCGAIPSLGPVQPHRTMPRAPILVARLRIISRAWRRTAPKIGAADKLYAS